MISHANEASVLGFPCIQRSAILEDFFLLPPGPLCSQGEKQWELCDQLLNFHPNKPGPGPSKNYKGGL